MKYFIGYALEREAKWYHEELTRELAGRFGVEPLHEKQPPHITLIPPFSEKKEERIFSILKEIVCHASSANFHLGDFGHFGTGVIFLKVSCPKPLALFHRAVFDALKPITHFSDDLYEKHKTLHSSVARFLSEEQFRVIWQYLLALPSPEFTLDFDRVTLFAKPNDKWELYKQFILLRNIAK
ncbi:2'-5' RNA ligase family protein [Patescibacteria group bacterium]|nr:MAG: 2'-5' RNA ligase family protein [Patescibacteria group bacterium]